MDRSTVRRLLLSMAARVPAGARRPGQPPRILLIRPDHVGDLLFMTPALHALRQALPDAHIACLIGSWGEPILAGNPDVDELLICDFPWFNRRAKASVWQPYATLWREAKRLRQSGFDVAAVMRFDFWWGAWLARLAGIPRRIGYNIAEVRPFLTEAIRYQAGLHEVRQNLRLAAAITEGPHPQPFSRPQERGGEPQEGPHPQPLSRAQERGGEERAEDQPLRFTIAAGDAAWAAARLAASPDDRSPDPEPRTPDPGARLFFALHPGAGAAVKLWDVERWAAVANEIARRHAATMVLTGGQGETALVQAVADRLTVPYINLAGQTSLGQLAAVFARCALVMGPDSGPLHLAVAAGAPTVHLFGPIDPSLFGPWGDPRKQIVVQARYFDRPCYNRPCNRLDYTPAELPMHPCMQTITVADVLAAVEKIKDH